MKSFLISALLLLLSIGAAITCSVYTDRFCNAVTELTERLPDDSELSEMGAIERGENSDAEMNFSADSSDALAALNELSELWDKHRKSLDIFVTADYLNQAEQSLIRLKAYYDRGYFSDYLAELAVFNGTIKQIRLRETLSPENLY